MADSKLKIDIRRNKILEQLRAQGKVSVSQLSASLGATPVTIRNDLAALERDGYLVRMQGGAVQAQRGGSLFGTPEAGASPEKKRISEEAVKRIRDGETLFVNSGTTTHQLAKCLQTKQNLNVVTNSLAVAMELGNISNFKVLLLGGEINARYGFTYGGDVQEQLSKYQADWAILSVDGVSARGGVTTHHAEEVIIDRMMIGNAKKVMIVADSSKIGRAGFSRVCDCDSRIWLVTNEGCDPLAAEEIRETGVNMYTAQN